MNESRWILAVDEQRATLDFLLSVLPLIEGEHFETIRVFSAEEGLLELRRRPYDILIAGLRLPGMDGLELARRAKKLRPAMPIILATARPLPELRDQATALGVEYFLRKPLDAVQFVDAVQESLAAAPPVAVDLVENGVAGGTRAVEELPVVNEAVVSRLETLCDEVGAGQVLLATVAGDILHVTGGHLHSDVPRLVVATAASVSRGLFLSDQLDEREPRVVQFVEGETTDLYWANVGQDYFIAILFDAQIRRGRIGTVWVFTQRAVDELKKHLTNPPADPPATSAGPVKAGAGQQAAKKAPPQAVEPPAENVSADAEIPPAPEPPVAPDDQDDAAQQIERTADEMKLDAFWDEALATDGGDVFTNGISLEEAKAKGLVADDFDADDRPVGDD